MSDELTRTETHTPWRGLLATARQVGHYAWTERRLFEILGAWSVHGSEPSVAVLLDAQSHQHAWHASVLFDRLPELREVDADALLVAPSPAFERWVDDLGATDDTVGRLTGLYEVVLPGLLAAYRTEVSTRTDVGDASLRRWLGRLIVDLEDAVGVGDDALAGLLTDPALAASAASRRESFDLGWSDAGGLHP